MSKVKSFPLFAGVLFSATFLAGCVKEMANLKVAGVSFTSLVEIPHREQLYSIVPAGAVSTSGETMDGHKATPRFELALLKGDTLKFRANLHRNTYYSVADIGGKNQVNKLFGFTDCNSVDPQANSARFGWTATNGKMIVLPYVDFGGNHQTPHLYNLNTGLAIDLDRFYTYQIQIEENNYHFIIWDDQDKTLLDQVVPRHCNSASFKSILNPFFGGTQTAPWKMDIEVDIL